MNVEDVVAAGFQLAPAPRIMTSIRACPVSVQNYGGNESRLPEGRGMEKDDEVVITTASWRVLRNRLSSKIPN